MQKEPKFNQKEYRVKTGTAFYECYRERFSRRNRRSVEQSIVFKLGRRINRQRRVFKEGHIAKRTPV